jgi:hypothetical protein
MSEGNDREIFDRRTTSVKASSGLTNEHAAWTTIVAGEVIMV